MPYISEETLREIREKVNILQLISSFVKLKKVGANYVGLCPFHSEKTPSFTVHEGKGIFHCFGCGAGGNVFTFVMRHSNMSFPEAAEDLAKKAGIHIEKSSFSDDKRSREERERLRRINDMAAQYFHNVLINSPVGKEGREYLKTRQVPDAVISAYVLGYAPDLWNGLLDHLAWKKADLSLAEKVGLLVRKREGGHYDRFRHRIMFPIHDISGLVAGFGGRAIGKEEPKYLNSPESPLYSKGKILFGLNTAREHIMKNNFSIIVEGYFDLLALHAHGIYNAVATLGTALTPEHVSLLKRFARDTVVVFDPDEGGKKAAQRSLGVFLEKEMIAKIVLLPDGNDPDVFLKRYGEKDFLSLVQKARPLIDFVLDECRRRHGTSIQEKARAVEELIPLVHSMKSPVEIDLFTRKISETFGVREEAVRESLKKPAAVRFQPYEVQEEGKYPKAEMFILLLMVHRPESIQRVKEEGALALFKTQALKELGERLMEEYDKRQESSKPREVIDFLENDEQKSILSKLAMEGDSIGHEEWEKALDDALRSLGRAKLKEQQKLLGQKLRKAEEGKNEAMVADLLKQKMELTKRERGLKW